MKSTIFLDPDFNFLLLENEESEAHNETKLFINVNTSAAANQRFEISVAGASPVTIYLPSNARVNFELASQFWADDAATEITPKNANINGQKITITFPKSFDTSAALNYINNTEFEVAAQNKDFANAGEGSGSGSSTSGSSFDFIETIRNIGYRLLDEPSDVNIYYDDNAGDVKIKWTDPADISTNEPVPAEWAGTVVVKKQGSAPLHKWDGELITDSTTRDQYANNPLSAGGMPINSVYYFGVFPYDTRGWYRYTKSMNIRRGDVTIYGIKISKSNSNPATRCEYLLDAIGKTPAKLENGSFNYGGWSNAWFIRDNYPVMLKYNGEEDYRLSSNNYGKKEDGVTESDVANINYDGNAMSAMPLVWLYQYEDTNYKYMFFANQQVDYNYKAYAHTDSNGNVNDYIYMSIYRGSIDNNGRIRSISGQRPFTKKKANEEIAAAKANGTGWFTKTWAQRNLLSSLLTLILCNTNSQAALGRGHLVHSDSEAQNYGILTTGTANARGQFWGNTSNNYQVKAFHQESPWGDQSDALAGLILINGRYKVKMTPPYAETNLNNASTYNSYTEISATPGLSYGGWIKSTYMSEYGDLPIGTGGSSSTYECDTLWNETNNRICYPAVGGDNGAGDGAGLFQMGIINTPDRQTWDTGASLSFVKENT